jgi:hypothetical protein
VFSPRVAPASDGVSPASEFVILVAPTKTTAAAATTAATAAAAAIAATSTVAAAAAVIVAAERPVVASDAELIRACYAMHVVLHGLVVVARLELVLAVAV